MYQPNTDKPIFRASTENNFPPPVSTDKRLLDLLLMSIEDETTDTITYKRMAESQSDDEAKDILKSMYLDETRHQKLLQDIYTALNGSEPPAVEIKQEPLLGYQDQLKKNVLHEIEGARFYRDLVLLFEDPEFSGIIMGILSDEQNHAILSNLLMKK